MLVWYVSYGSNLCRERFMCYIRGGSPAGSTFNNPGCQNRSDPRDSRGLEIPAALYFAQAGPGWSGGGAAFVDPDEPGTTLARSYLVTGEQFVDIVRQENADDPCRPTLNIDLDAVLASRYSFIGAGAAGTPYSRLVPLDMLNGYRALTFTSPASQGERTPLTPSDAYLTTIIRGLAETFPERSVSEIVSYLLAAPGIQGRLDEAHIRRLVAPHWPK